MKDRPARSAHPWRKYLEAEICARPPNRGVQAENAQPRQRLRHLSPDQHPVCLDKGENGCENLGCPGKELPHHVALRLTQQPSEDGARLSVESHRLPRSAASRSAEVC